MEQATADADAKQTCAEEDEDERTPEKLNQDMDAKYGERQLTGL